MLKIIISLMFIGCKLAEYQPGPEADAKINTYESEISPDGSHQLTVETTNGIIIQEQGVAGFQASGQSLYVAPDGTPIQLLYTADEFGFHPQGDHLPKPPPIPEAILRSLEWNAAHAKAEYQRKSKH
ncbi:unnamed protein product [Hermetia illucens]|uniref:Uncharacterized protein n=1 Tax=Hermetia illucens TaxID=343691 RepID=A0A7R8YSY7_HERIL|nr:pupal cuticle protein Edg-78E-like [Hermetia illucens]CAD7084137.1 unnamed protein product [Hermetia illucens]